MNRIDRLTGIILLLQSHRSLTAAEIAAHWEISVRTVYRDLAALCEAGVPIVGEAGNGYHLMRGYHVPPIMFTEAEAAALFLSAEVAAQVADASLKRSLDSALLKVRSVLPDERLDYLARFDQSVGVWLKPSPPAPAEPERGIEGLMEIQDAILRRRCLELSYDAAGLGKISSRTVEPLGILFYSGQWHLIAFCRLREGFRDFRLDRIQSWRMRGETYTGHADFSVSAFLKAEIDRCELVPVVVVVDQVMCEKFRSELFCKPTREQELEAGRVRMEILAFSLPWFAEWLLRFGSAVLVEEPAELRRHLKEAALRVVNQNSEDFSK